MTQSPRLAPLLTQLDTSLEISLARMAGMTDEEFWWLPEPTAGTVVRRPDGRLEPTEEADDGLPSTRTIVVLTGHLVDMAILRTDYTTGGRSLAKEDVDWPDNAAQGIESLKDSWAGWRAALASLSDSELDEVGRCAFPWGLDPKLPVLDIAWWMNRELIHHTAEIAFVRDLYARR